jgi:hypothetical protein
MEDRRSFHLLIHILLVFVPVNIYVIGNWLGTGIQWVFFRYQQTYIGPSFIPVTWDLLYVLNGVISGKTALSLTLWSIGAIIILISISLMFVNYLADFRSSLVPALLLGVGICALLLGMIVQYGISFHTSSGFCIPVGIPLFMGYCLWTLSTERENLNRETPKRQWQVFREYLRKAYPVLLILCIFFVYNSYTGTITSRDTFPAAILPYNLFQHHTLAFDNISSSPLLSYQDGTPSYAIQNINGNYYSLFPIVIPILLVPFYAAQYLLLAAFAIPITDVIILQSAKNAAACMATLTCIIFFATARELFEERIAFYETVIFAFATATWSISSQALWQHGLGELLLISMIYLIVKNETADSPFYLALLGLLSGLFVFNRPPDAILLIPVILYVIIWQRKKITRYLIPAVLAGLPFLLYNELVFGSPAGGYAKNMELFFFGGQFISNFLGLFIAPNKGLLVYSPVLILAFFGFIVIRKDTSRRYLTVIKFFSFAFLAQVLLYSFFSDWIGGYCFGPRFLTDAVPVLVLFCGFFLSWLVKVPLSPDWKKIIGIFIVVLVITSIVIQVIGVFYFPFWTDINMDTVNAWDLQNSQILSSYHQGSEGIKSLKIIDVPPIGPLIEYNIRDPDETAISRDAFNLSLLKR